MAKDIKKLKDSVVKLYDYRKSIKGDKPRENYKISKILNEMSEDVDKIYDFIAEKKAIENSFENLNSLSKELSVYLKERLVEEDYNEIHHKFQLIENLEKIIENKPNDIDLLPNLLIISGNFATIANDLKN